MFSFKEINLSAFIYRLYPLIIGFSILSVVSNIFPSEDLSLYILFNNLKSYFGLILTFGLAPVITRNIATESSHGWNLIKAYKAMACLFFGIILVFFLLNFDPIYFLSLISGLIFGLYYLIESYFRGKKLLFKAVFFTKILLPSILLTTIISKYFYDIKLENILFSYILAGLVFFLVFSLKNMKIFENGHNRNINLSDLSELNIVFFISAITNVFIVIPIIILNYLGDESALIQVGIAIMLSNVALLIFQVGNENFAKDFNVLISLKKLKEVKNKNYQVGKINFFLAISFSLCLFVLKEPLGYIFNVEGNDYIYMAILISLFYGVAMFLGLPGLILLALHKSHLLLKNSIVTLLFSASLYSYFIIFSTDYNNFTLSILIGSTYLFYFFLNYISVRKNIEDFILNS